MLQFFIKVLVNSDVVVSDIADCAIYLLDFNDNEVVIGRDVLDINILRVIVYLKENATTHVNISLGNIDSNTDEDWLAGSILTSQQQIVIHLGVESRTLDLHILKIGTVDTERVSSNWPNDIVRLMDHQTDLNQICKQIASLCVNIENVAIYLYTIPYIPSDCFSISELLLSY